MVGLRASAKPLHKLVGHVLDREIGRHGCSRMVLFWFYRSFRSWAQVSVMNGPNASDPSPSPLPCNGEEKTAIGVGPCNRTPSAERFPPATPRSPAWHYYKRNYSCYLATPHPTLSPCRGEDKGEGALTRFCNGYFFVRISLMTSRTLQLATAGLTEKKEIEGQARCSRCQDAPFKSALTPK